MSNFISLLKVRDYYGSRELLTRFTESESLTKQAV